MRRLWSALGLWCVFTVLLAFGCDFSVERVCLYEPDKAGWKPETYCGPGEVCYEFRCYPKLCDEGEQRPCYEGGECTLKDPQDAKKGYDCKGTCKAGVQICQKSGSVWSACIGQDKPEDEFCDGQDNDCDGEVDEGLSGCTCEGNETRGCALAATQEPPAPCYKGLQRCLYDAKTKTRRWGPCEGRIRPNALLEQVLACTIRDADCDGQPDDFGLKSCNCAVGTAPRPCSFRKADGLPTNCVREQVCACNEKRTELCTWEGTASYCEKGISPRCKCIPFQCTDGAPGQWTRCIKDQEKKALQEEPSCNKREEDRDCDGKPDNQQGWWRGCVDPGGGLASHKDCGLEYCTKGRDGEYIGSTCEVREVCANGGDEDCDGQVDEKPCMYTTCQDKEYCDNKTDDNCDGQTDESGCVPLP